VVYIADDEIVEVTREKYRTYDLQRQRVNKAVEDITWQVAPNDAGAAVYRAKRLISQDAAAFMRVRLILPDSNP